MLQHLLETALLHLRIDLLRHEAILLDSEGDGIKPGALHRGDWPTPVLHVGKLIKIPSAPLLALLSEQPEVTLHADFVDRSRS